MSNIIEHDLDPEELEQEEEAFDTSSQGSSTQTSTLTWINWYTSLPGHDYFCEVHEDFIEDDFNLTGLQSMVPFWKEALEMVLDVEPDEDVSKIPDVSIVENSAELLYGLVHQRFILTKTGLGSMLDKYEQGHFGACPRVFCHSTYVLPCGRADMPGVDTVKLYCPNCGDIYTPPSSKYAGIDGAFFGTTFAPLFFGTYPELLSAPFCPTSHASTPHGTPTPTLSETHSRGLSPSPPSALTGNMMPIGGEVITNPNPHGGQKAALGKVYIPRIYGFKVSERARSGPRMKWLRERPEKIDYLDLVDYKGRWKDNTEGGNGGNGGGKGGNTSLTGEDIAQMAADAGGGGLSMSGGGGSGRRGRLFDEDDEENEDEEEEEEEEGGGGVGGGGVQQTAVSQGGKQTGGGSRISR